MSNKENRQFIASSELFSDFSVEISLYSVESLDDIIQIFVRELRECLSKHNLNNLVKEVDKKNFHIHGKTIEMILTSKCTESFFICDHE